MAIKEQVTPSYPFFLKVAIFWSLNIEQAHQSFFKPHPLQISNSY